MNKADYEEPRCVLCGKPGETEKAEPVPVGRILDRLNQYEEAGDLPAAERHLNYWLAEAESLGDKRGQLALHNEMMGFYRMRGNGETAQRHAEGALRLLDELEMGDTITAGTVRVNAGTVREAFGDPVGGLDLFEQARKNYEQHLDPADSRLGGLYNNMALSLTACGRFGEAETMFRKALSVMEKQEHGEPEQAITWLNLADNAAAAYGEIEAEGMIGEYLDKAQQLLDTETIPRNAYYAFVCEKCAPVFGHYGYFAEEAELKERVKQIHDGN